MDILSLFLETGFWLATVRMATPLIFGTRMYIPGYGWGIVEDKGGAIKGPDRIDLFFDSHADAIQWGRRKVAVEIERR